MIDEICVIGHPSFCGGADTELYDQIKCWHKMGIQVYICHTAPIYGSLLNIQKDLIENYNCKYITPRQWQFLEGMHCISFCNGEFLKNIHYIKKHAKTTTFVNCMTWNFHVEVKAQSKGLIDFHLYQTQHAFDKVSVQLKKFKDYKPILFNPYFDSSKFKYINNRPNDHFRFGRISRADMQKYSHDQFIIYDKIKSKVPKSGVVLGWNHLTEHKTNIKPSDIIEKKINNKVAKFYKNYIQLCSEGFISQQDFYNFCDVLILNADTFENLPRVGFECMASGTILVVNNRGGWTLQVKNEETGFLCDTSEDFINKSTFLANNPGKKEEIREASYKYLEDNWGLEKSMKSWDLVFKQVSNY